jgi:putative DNA primase/helicase
VTDPVAFALAQLVAFGFKLDRIEVDGRIHRCPHDDDKSGKKSCWYVAHLVRLHDNREAVIGAYGRFVGAENQREKFELPEKGKLNDFDRHRIKVEQKRAAEQADQARQDAALEAARRAAEIWSKLPSCSDSPYLTKKGVGAYGLARGKDGTVVVPMRNASGALAGLQFIQADGTKKFLSGQRTQGAFHLIGTVSLERPIILAEGYATAASCHMATSWPVVVCFDAGNLTHVSPAVRQKYPGVQIIVAGDDDHEKKENAGRMKAPAAAEKVRGSVVFPQFKEPAGKTDFNDLHAAEGLEAVAAQLKKAFIPLAPAHAGEEHSRGWQRDLVWGDKGLLVTKYNLILILENDPAWKDVLAYDEFARQIVKRQAPPYGGVTGAMGDHDDAELAAWFERKDTYQLSVSTMVAREAALAVAHRHKFHPVREYLDSLKWDDDERIPSFFEKYCGVKATDPAQPELEHAVPREVIKKFALNFFIAAVARIYKPGCKADLMLVLEGEQGSKKSTLVELLAGGPQYYVDLGTSPADKDFYQIIQGRWLVEISELASFAKAETSHIKRAVSSHTDTFRPSYARYVQQFPRECLFFGTANDADWQRDSTGGRRFMPLWVGMIDFDAIAAVRDQLWAEAVVRFKEGEPWWLLPPGAAAEQEARYVEDPWAEPVVRWLNGDGGLNQPLPSATSAEIMEHALKIEPKKQDRVAQRRVGELMRRLGWKRTQKRLGKAAVGDRSRVWLYKRPAEQGGDQC